MSNYAFGIDLGTTTTVISYLKNGQPVPISDPQLKHPLIPSEISLDANDRIVVGAAARTTGRPYIKEAKRMMGTDQRFEIGNRTFLPEEVAAEVLKKAAANARAALGVEVAEAVITVPAYFADAQIRATQRAAQLAGIDALRLIPEPLAAAIAFAADNMAHEGKVLVFDFGGGTLDVTILEMISGILEVHAHFGDNHLGGADMDESIALSIGSKHLSTVSLDSLKETEVWQNFCADCEKTKKNLSYSDSATVSVDLASTELRTPNEVMSRLSFEIVIAPLLQRCIDCIDVALTKVGYSKSEIRTLLLVGGSCHIPKVRECVESHLGLKAAVGIEPDLAVSMGACINAGIRSGMIDPSVAPIDQDVMAMGFGVAAWGLVGNQHMLKYIEHIPAGKPFGTVRTEQYRLQRLDQDIVEVEVFQNTRFPGQKEFEVEKAAPTGYKGVIPDIPPSTTDEPRKVDITFSTNQDRRITVHAKIVGIDRAVTIVFEDQALGELPQVNPFAGGNEQNSTLGWQSTATGRRHLSYIQRAEQILSDSPPNAERIEAVIEELKIACARDDSNDAQSARDRLTDLLSDVV